MPAPTLTARLVCGTVVCLLLTGMTSTPSIAEKSEEKQQILRPTGFKRLGHDAAYLARKPFKLERRGKIKAAVMAGTTLLLFGLRDEIREEAAEARGPGRSRFLQDARNMGKGAFASAVALLVYGGSLASGNERGKETAFLVLESAAFSAVAALTGSFVLASERPEDGDDLRLFRTSGHGVSLDAALASSVIPPLRRTYLLVKPGDTRTRRFLKRTAVVALHAGAGLTAWQRIDQDQHWAPDVFLGLATGLLVGENLCDAHRYPGRRRMQVRPGSPSGGAGFTIVIHLDSDAARSR